MPRPWNAYGEVRGLNAPPRRTVAPEAATDSAVSISCSRLSTEHGPAMTVRPPSPMTASRTRITVSSGWNSREVSLNGREIGVTRSTPGSAPNWPISASRRLATSPTTARTVPFAPACSYGVRPSARMRLFTPRISASLAPWRMTTNISAVYLRLRLRNKKAEVLRLCHRPTLPDGPVIPGSSHAGPRYSK